MEARTEIVEEGTYNRDGFVEELGAAPHNHELGTTLWYENDQIRVWEILLLPGERGAFHAHITNYFWTVVEAGRGLQRFADGRFIVRDYLLGETRYLEHTPDTALIHDLENVGETTLRFVTVELLG